MALNGWSQVLFIQNPNVVLLFKYSAKYTIQTLCNPVPLLCFEPRRAIQWKTAIKTFTVNSKTYLFFWSDFKLPTSNWEATAKLLRSNVSSIFHCHILFNGTDKSPEFFFNQLSGDHLGIRKGSMYWGINKQGACASKLSRGGISISLKLFPILKWFHQEKDNCSRDVVPGDAAALFSQEWLTVAVLFPTDTLEKVGKNQIKSQAAGRTRNHDTSKNQDLLTQMRSSDLGFHPIQNQNPPLPPSPELSVLTNHTKWTLHSIRIKQEHTCTGMLK